MIKNTEMSGFGMEDNAEENAMSGNVNLDLDERKIATRNGVAQVHVCDNKVTITNSSNGILVNERGTAIVNPMHFAADPGSIRINSFWVLNDEILTTLPSTIYTPIPMLRYKRPVFAEIVTDLGNRLKG